MPIPYLAGAYVIDGGELRPTKKEDTAHWNTSAALFKKGTV